jgi:hypothetical protein
VNNSLHFGFRDAFVSRLSTPPALVDGGVLAGRKRPMPEAVNAQIFVDLDDSPALPVTLGNAVEWSTRIRVRVLARTVGATQSDVLADRYMTAAYGRVMADPYFSGAALQTDPAGIAWATQDEAETTASECTAVFTVRHRAPRASVAA